MIHKMFLLFVIACLCSCSVPKIEHCFKDGKDYSKIHYITIREDWDSCYLRGASYMRGECYDLAINEFNKAIAKRPNDKRITRPYGMHFLEYFPHRELGISYLKLGYVHEAIKELEKSLEDSPSSKAKYFLNQARKKYLTQNYLDNALPKVHLTFPPSETFFTNKTSLRLKGIVEDDQFISALSINNEPIFIELSNKNVTFDHTVLLNKGLNQINITATDLLDKTAEKKVKIIVDQMGPIINLSYSYPEYVSTDLSNKPNEDNKYVYNKKRTLVKGIIFEDSKIENFSINGQPINIEQKKVSEFSQWINLLLEENQLFFSAYDIAGNETSGYIKLSNKLKSRRMLKSQLDNETYTMDNIETWEKGCIQVASLDTSSINFYASNENSGTLQNVDPYLSIEPLPQVTIYDQIYLMGKIQYRENITSINLFLNNKHISEMNYDTSMLSKLKNIFTEKENKVLFLGEIIKLDPGQNKIIIEAANEIGITKHESFTILKKEEDILDEKYRLCIATLPIEDVSEPEWISPYTGRYLFRKLDASFVNQKRFQVVERERLEQILKELKLSISDLSDKKRAIEIGKIVIAEAIFISYMRLHGKDAIELGGTMVDIETSKHLCNYEDIYLEGDSDDVKTKAAEILAMKIRKHFPLCRGRVLKKKGKKIIINIGQHENINNSAKLIVYRKDEWDAAVLSEARVERVFDDHCRAVLIGKNGNSYIGIDDLVITK